MKITVLTTTYNRNDKLKLLFKSLQEQTNYNFKWLVIDDGSTDETELSIKKMIEFCNLFEIAYFKKINGGKHTAINYGLTKVCTEYCLIIDSDDVLKANAIEFFLNKWKSVDQNVAAISCLTEDKKGDIVGDLFPTDGMEMSHIEQVYRMNIHGDKVECYRTVILQENPFPTFYQERFLTEAVVWNRIGKVYNKKCFNCSLRINEYHEDGLTNNLENHHRNSLFGSLLYHYEASDLIELSKIQVFKHRCIAMKYLWFILFKHVAVNFIALPVGLMLMIRSYFK